MSRDIAHPLSILETTLRTMKLEFLSIPLDPFVQGRLNTYIENMLQNVADLKAPPARAPGKHEPEPIVIAAKPTRPRAQKGH